MCALVKCLNLNGFISTCCFLDYNIISCLSRMTMSQTYLMRWYFCTPHYFYESHFLCQTTAVQTSIHASLVKSFIYSWYERGIQCEYRIIEYLRMMVNPFASLPVLCNSILYKLCFTIIYIHIYIRLSPNFLLSNTFLARTWKALHVIECLHACRMIVINKILFFYMLHLLPCQDFSSTNRLWFHLYIIIYI